MPIGKWSVETSRIVHSDRWIDIRAEHVVTARGDILDPYYVLRYPDWVHIVAITPEDQMIMLRQYRHAAGEIGLELPYGSVEPRDRGPQDATARELAEETGYIAPTFKHIASLYANPATHTNKVHTFLAANATLSGRPQIELGEESILELIPVSAVFADLGSGLVTQSMHVASIALAMAALSRTVP
jgi:8-oxo-dGTP pyrophosphatase MutT (NUDIX family)